MILKFKFFFQSTRLGKYINDIRRRTTHPELNRRTKDLVRKWRREVVAEGVNGVAPSGPGPGGGGANNDDHSSAWSGGQATPGGGRSPSSLPSSGHTSPAPATPRAPSARASPTPKPTRGTKRPHHLISDGPKSPGRESRSPAATPPFFGARGTTPVPRRPNEADPSYAPSTENVAKTNAANKRLRKDDKDVHEWKSQRSNGYEDESTCDSFSSNVSLGCVSGSGGYDVTTDDKSQRFHSRKNKNKLPADIRKKYGQNHGLPELSSSRGNDEASDGRRDENLDSVSREDGVLKQKRRSGRKRKADSGSRDLDGVTHSAEDSDSLRWKAAMARESKVKTTKQLVAELAERKGDAELAQRASKIEEQIRELNPLPLVRSDQDVLRNKMEHMHRFLKSRPEPDDEGEVNIVDDDEEEEEDGPSGAPSRPASPFGVIARHEPLGVVSNLDLLGVDSKETAEEIMSRLPPVDLSSIVWDDPIEDVTDGDEMEAEREPDETEEERISRLEKDASNVDAELVENLHANDQDCLNGNVDESGRFREWHDVGNQRSYQDSPLVLLPYVIMDF